MTFSKIQSVAKFLVALIGTLVTAGTTFIPEEYGPWLGFAAAILTAVATYAVPNKPVALTPEHLAE